MNFHAVIEPTRSRLRRLLQPPQLRLADLLESPQLSSPFERLCQGLTARHIVVIGASGREGASSVATRLALTLARRSDEIARLTANTISIADEGAALAGLLQNTPAAPDPATGATADPVTGGPLQVPPRPTLLGMPSPNRTGQVLLAEGNLRTPTLGAQLGIDTDVGLRQWDLRSPLPTLQANGLPQMSLLLAGPPTPGAETISLSTRLTAAAERAQADFDYVVWDSPPLTLYPDALTLAARSDGALVVIEMDHTRTDDLQFVRDTLTAGQARIIGSVLNRSNRYWPRIRQRTHYGASAHKRP